MTSTATPLIAGLDAIAERYDGYLIDLWGVMHDGVAVYPAARHCLERLAERGARVVLLSNAPRRSGEAVIRNEKLGIPRQLYRKLVTSGEESWRDLAARADPFWQDVGPRYFPIMAERDRSVIEGLALTPVSVAAADFLLCTGVEDDKVRVEDFDAALDIAARRGLKMLCANPDLEVVRGGVREICAGAVAAAYERRGGEVRYHGKPHAPIYRRCFEEMIGIPPARILAIGDSLRTDIAGAAAAGIASLFVTDGIHGAELGGASPDPAKLARKLAAAAAQPTYVSGRLSW